jgi:hypothetical protein
MRWIGLLILIGGLLSGLVLQTTLRHVLLIFYAAEYGLAPFFLLLIIWSVVSIFRAKKLSPLSLIGWRIAICLFLCLLLSLAAGIGVHSLRVHATRSAVDTAIKTLDQIKRQTGSYPPQLPTRSGLWEWLGYPIEYQEHKTSFMFRYTDGPEGEGDLNWFDSDGRTWSGNAYSSQ